MFALPLSRKTGLTATKLSLFLTKDTNNTQLTLAGTLTVHEIAMSTVHYKTKHEQLLLYFSSKC